jgi:hypothetical protein
MQPSLIRLGRFQLLGGASVYVMSTVFANGTRLVVDDGTTVSGEFSLSAVVATGETTSPLIVKGRNSSLWNRIYISPSVHISRGAFIALFEATIRASSPHVDAITVFGTLSSNAALLLFGIVVINSRWPAISVNLATGSNAYTVGVAASMDESLSLVNAFIGYGVSMNMPGSGASLLWANASSMYPFASARNAFQFSSPTLATVVTDGAVPGSGVCASSVNNCRGGLSINPAQWESDGAVVGLGQVTNAGRIYQVCRERDTTTSHACGDPPRNSDTLVANNGWVSPNA